MEVIQIIKCSKTNCKRYDECIYSKTTHKKYFAPKVKIEFIGFIHCHDYVKQEKCSHDFLYTAPHYDGDTFVKIGKRYCTKCGHLERSKNDAWNKERIE